MALVTRRSNRKTRTGAQLRIRPASPWPLRFLGTGIALTIITILLGSLAWAIGYRYTPYLPSAESLVDEIALMLSERETYVSVGISLRRLAAGLLLGYTAAVFVAVAMRLRRWWRWFFAPYVLATLATPSLVAALASVMIFGFSEVGVYVAVAVIIFPFVVLSLDEGLNDIDAKVQDMASVYRLTRMQRFRAVLIPQISPELFAAFRNAHALAWKIVIVAELFSQSTGIGYQYQLAYDFFNVERMSAWLVFFLSVVFFVEYGLLRPWERHLFRWRSAT